ncbi:hypothetical protein HK104_011163 [Borealophlyctis nickersoniae]|nr:hypothetical protein HK104_011163 [Borealophlyctis nickersoniae]
MTKLTLAEAYETLEVPYASDVADCKIAYKKLAKKYHPDKNMDADTTTHFQRLSAAYQRIESQGTGDSDESDEDEEAMEEDYAFRMHCFRQMFERMFMQDHSKPAQQASGGHTHRHHHTHRYQQKHHSRSSKASSSAGSRTSPFTSAQSSKYTSPFTSTFDIHFDDPYTDADYYHTEELLEEMQYEKMMRAEENEMDRREYGRSFESEAKPERGKDMEQERLAREAKRKEELVKEEEQRAAEKRHHERLVKLQQLRSRAFAAARDGKLDILKAAVQNEEVTPAGYEYVDRNLQRQKNVFGETLMHIAARRNDLDIARFLMDSGVPIEKDENGRFPLHLAAMHNAFELVDFLVSELSSQIDAKDQNGVTACALAAERGNVEVFDFLVEHGASLSVHDGRGRSIRYKVHQALAQADEPELRAKLSEIRERIDKRRGSHGRDQKRKSPAPAAEPATANSNQTKRATARSSEKEVQEKDDLIRQKQAEKLAEQRRKDEEELSRIEQLKAMAARGKTASHSNSGKKKRRKSSSGSTSVGTAVNATHPRTQSPATLEEDHNMDGLVAQLAAMGFDPERAASALKENDRNFDRTLEKLLQKSTASKIDQQTSPPKTTSTSSHASDGSRNAAFWAAQGGRPKFSAVPEVKPPSPQKTGRQVPVVPQGTSTNLPSVNLFTSATAFDALANVTEDASDVDEHKPPTAREDEEQKASSPGQKKHRPMVGRRTLPRDTRSQMHQDMDGRKGGDQRVTGDGNAPVPSRRHHRRTPMEPQAYMSFLYNTDDVCRYWKAGRSCTKGRNCMWLHVNS